MQSKSSFPISQPRNLSPAPREDAEQTRIPGLTPKPRLCGEQVPSPPGRELSAGDAGISWNTFLPGPPARRRAGQVSHGSHQLRAVPRRWKSRCIGKEALPRDRDGARGVAPTGAASCTGAGPDGSSRAPPAAAAASAPPPTRSGARSAPAAWSWAAGGNTAQVTAKGLRAARDSATLRSQRLAQKQYVTSVSF